MTTESTAPATPAATSDATTGYGVAWVLKLSSFAGISAGASHWMANLTGRVEDVEVSYEMTVDDARKISTHDYTYEPGDWSTRFHDRRSAEQAAIAAFRHLAGPRDVLVEQYDPVVLAGPDDLRTEARAFGEDDFWQWKDRFARHLYDVKIGYNAPPSVRRHVDVVMRLDGDAWMVADVRGLANDTAEEE
jgi:hypothetical protein